MMGGPPPPGPMGQQKFKLQWKLAFFVAACCTVGAGVIGVLDLAFFAFAPGCHAQDDLPGAVVGHAADADLRFEAHQVGGRPRVLLSTCLDGSFSWESV